MLWRILLIIIVSITWDGEVSAFWLKTHEKITTNAIGIANLNTVIKEQTGIDNPLGLTVRVLNDEKKLQQWLTYGSRQEDEPFSALRFLNHFYNPLDDSGLYGTFLSSYKWADDSRNEWRWYVARSAYYRALTSWSENDRKVALANSLRALGQVTHLVQDTAVPAHTRNDGHNPDGFERYVDLKIIPSGNFDFAKSKISVSSEAPRQFWDSEKYKYPNPDPSVTTGSDIGLAEYTNANFFSGGRIC